MKLTGRLLREARERKNVTLNEVSFTTKISIKVLQAIEEGNLDALPPKTFLRGFVRSYAEYLKVDVPSVMHQFAEEMGTTKPMTEIKIDGTSDVRINSTTPPPERLDVEQNLQEPKQRFLKLALIVVSLIVVGVAFFVEKAIRKYEAEKVAPTPSPTPEATIEAVLNAAITPASEPVAPVKPPVDAGYISPAPTPVSPASTVGSPLSVSPTSQASPSPSVTVRPTPMSIPSPTTTPVPSPSLAPTPSPTTAPTVSPTPSPTPSPKPSPTPSPTPKGAPQEVILEALDDVTVTFIIDGSAPKTVTMSRDQIRTFKAKRGLQLDVNDGGAVNLIHNGIDRGTPGPAGQSKSVKFP